MLNPELNVSRIGADFEKHDRTQVADVLESRVADELLQCLERQVPWSTAYIGAEGPARLDRAQFRQLSAAQQQRLLQNINELARREFQFLYDSYAMVTAYKEGRDPGLFLHKVLEFFNSPAYLDFARRVTGFDNIHRIDAQATRYLGGHFLKVHNDTHPDETRLVAYVLNLTRTWQADWGGLLQFMDADKRVIDTYEPRFNTLSLFRVPTWHCVSYVAPFAQAPRYAITGWMRSR